MKLLYQIGSLIVLLGSCLAAGAQNSAVPRPPITGVSHVAFYAADPAASKRFYAGTLGLTVGGDNLYEVGDHQWVEIESLPPDAGINRLSHVGFATTDAEALRKYLGANGITVPPQVNHGNNGVLWFGVKDPEGNGIEFVQGVPFTPAKATPSPVSGRIIHAGFIVHDRVRENQFYEKLLGFHLYWFGGMKQGQTDWVDVQVPDGTDWLEYMLMQPDAQVSPRLMGVLNHFALGVPSMNKAVDVLTAHNWKPNKEEHPQIGRDGKWQLNLYDPDGTRVELMEFAPTQKPCCSEYTGKHPSP